MSDEKTKETPVEAPKTEAATTEETKKDHKTSGEIIQEDADAVPKDKSEKEKQKAFESLSKTNKENKDSMNVKVYSPSRVYFDGLAFSVTAVNATGEFDVLPKHHRFISLIDECDLIIRSVGEGNRKISISGGMMHVKEDRVAVFLDI